MRRSVKVAISLPSDVLAAAEQERLSRNESRSEFICHAIEAFLRHEQQRVAIDRYIAGYMEHPETGEELRWSEDASAEVLAEEPWE